ncbi:MAG TPA: hypothetical protein VHM90_07580 [Phycisphaerae bacterium]|nr:hypothetical protein [Phycisphaerae bacterium]
MEMQRVRRAGHVRILMEGLEGRELFDAAPVFSGLIAVQAGQNALTSAAVLSGLDLHAQAGQSFQAVVGTLHNPTIVAASYILRGSIDWGDGSVSPATFVHRPDGSTDVLGSHTYAAAGSDTILVHIMAYPPAGSLAPVRLIGILRSQADVFVPNGGATLSETVDIGFTANLGAFRTAASTANAVAIIDWGDGSVSRGRIVAVPTTDPLAGGFFVVMGEHTYGAIGSYKVHITVFPVNDTPLASSAASVEKPLALIDSVIDVLPPLPTA